MNLQVGSRAILVGSDSAWAGALVEITDIDDHEDMFGKLTIYVFEVLDKSLPPYDSEEPTKEKPHMGATCYQSDFLEV